MHFPVVSLKNPTTIRRVTRRMERDPKVRREVFREIARKPELQREILAALAKHPTALRKVIIELASNLHVRRTILRLVTGSRDDGSRERHACFPSCWILGRENGTRTSVSRRRS